MGNVVDRFWDQGVPEVSEDLKHLQGWSREALIDAVERFKTQDRLSVRLAAFWKILDLHGRDEAMATWTALGLKEDGCVDFLSLILPMVAMSKQEIISRVTLIFSICDFNGNGAIKRSEFFIGLRCLFKGLSRFFPTATAPSTDDLEVAVETVFKSIDMDKSGELELEEMLTFGYRSKGTRALMYSFPVRDTRVFEALVCFIGADDTRQRARMDQVSKVESTMKSKLMLSPDPVLLAARRPRKSTRSTTWKEPVVITKPKAFMLWAVFTRLAKENIIVCDVFRAFLKNQSFVQDVLEESFDLLMNSHGVQCELAERAKLIATLQRQFNDPEFVSKIKDYDSAAKLSIRCIASLLWPAVPAKDISACLKWARQFQAFHILQELTRRKENSLSNSAYDPDEDAARNDLTRDDVEALFEVLDADGDGTLTVEELIAGGLKPEQANRLMALWDRDRSNELDKGEIMGIIWGMNQVVLRQMKGLFAASVASKSSSILQH